MIKYILKKIKDIYYHEDKGTLPVVMCFVVAPVIATILTVIFNFDPGFISWFCYAFFLSYCYIWIFKQYNWKSGWRKKIGITLIYGIFMFFCADAFLIY
jgi:hypothetical protein